MPTTHVVLFTRDLRVHDHPALCAAVAEADRVVPLFVLDEVILGSSFAAPNRVQFLVESLRDLRASLQGRGGDLVVRRGDVADEVRGVVDEVAATAVHVTDDVSAYATQRARRLREALVGTDATLELHPGHLLVAPGEVTPTGGDHFKVFTPYWRRWREAGVRAPSGPPTGVSVPDLDPGRLPARDELVDGAPSPRLEPGGERVGRDRLDDWLRSGIAAYEDVRDDLAHPVGGSGLSAHLHFGTLSVVEVADRLDLRRRGHEPFLRQLCWREFNHQVLAARPSLPVADYRPRGDAWRDDEEAFAAWRDGRTGYPIVDAGMRQLQAEGRMHNRVRMLTASFLAKHLRLDWRWGARHFAHWLVDGDLANNWAQWQWAAGTGNDSRPNRMFNPVAQARRYDPHGTYVRRHVPELAEVADTVVHAPWQADDTPLAPTDYPAPIVDHAVARERFLADRNR